MRTSLHTAAAAGNVEAVEYLLRQGASVHIRFKKFLFFISELSLKFIKYSLILG